MTTLINMKKSLLNTLILLLSLILFFPAPLLAALWRLGTYDSKFYSISALDEWNVKKSPDGYGTEIFFPPQGKKKFTDLYYRVTILRFHGTLDEYNQALQPAINKSVKKYPVTKSQLGNFPAYQFTFEDTTASPPQKSLRVYALDNGLIFDIIFTCNLVNFDWDSPLIEEIIKSFTVKKP
jgi:hypothetical protein